MIQDEGSPRAARAPLSPGDGNRSGRAACGQYFFASAAQAVPG